MKKQVALFGLGRMGQIHLTNLQSHADVSLKYVFDPAMPAYRSSSIDTILDDNEIEACIIATPSTKHAELIKAFAKAGKHVFCEKPVSFDIDTLLEVKDVVEKAAIKLQIGFNRRFDPSFKILRDQVLNNEIGDLHLIKITNRDPVRPRHDFVKDSGGLFFDFNVHDFDMLRFVTGDEVAEIYAVGDALIDQELKSFDDIDTAIITAKMKSGALAVIDSSRETGYGYDQALEVFGARGAFMVKNQSATSISVRNNEGLNSDHIFPNFQTRYLESYRLELASFFSTPSCSPNIDDAIAAVKIARAAFHSQKENRSVAIY